MTSSHCVAVIGTGSAGTRHLEVLRTLESVRAIAVSKRPERVKELREAGYCVTEDLRQAANMGADLCVVATDTARHAEHSNLAMECGFGVLVEKPIAATFSEAQIMSLRSCEHQRKLFVGCVLRFSESLNVFRERLAGIGRLHSVRIECQSYLPDWRPSRPYRESYSARASEGGVLRDLIHEIDYAGWIFGWPSAVQARLKNLGRLGIEAEEIAELNWETSGGCIVSIGIDYLTRSPRRRIRALGESGTLEWDGIIGTVTTEHPGSREQVFHSSQTRNQMLAEQDLAFINAGPAVCDSRLATGLDGLKALAICDAARQAATRRAEEPVRYL